MTGDDEAGTEYDQPRVPTPLRERVDELFLAQRGYEPASFQEALSVVVDLATATAGDAASPDAAGARPGSDSGSGRSSSTATGPGAADGPVAGSTDSPEAGTGPDADSDEQGIAALDPDADGSVSFDQYVEGLEETSQDPSPSVESILDTEHADGVVRELAAEVLDEMTDDAFEELEHGVDHGVGAGVTDGMGAAQTADSGTTAPSGTTGDGVPDSLTADPESDCAVCGRSHRVSILQTTILEEDGSVALVCPSCAE